MSRCRHVWKVTDQQILSSPMDKLIAAGLTSLNSGSFDPQEFCKQPVIVSVECVECGTQEVRRV